MTYALPPLSRRELDALSLTLIDAANPALERVLGACTRLVQAAEIGDGIAFHPVEGARHSLVMAGGREVGRVYIYTRARDGSSRYVFYSKHLARNFEARSAERVRAFVLDKLTAGAFDTPAVESLL